MDFEDLMIRIKNVLAEYKHNGADIKNIELFTNLEDNIVVKYTQNDRTYVISVEEVQE